MCAAILVVQIIGWLCERISMEQLMKGHMALSMSDVKANFCEIVLQENVRSLLAFLELQCIPSCKELSKLNHGEPKQQPSRLG